MASSVDEQSVISRLQDVPPVQKRVQLFHQVLDSVPDAREDQNIPNVLFEDWSEDHVVQDENFSRDIIRSFRDTNREAWEELLSSCTENQKEMLEDFTNGKVLDDVYDKFDFDSTRGTRQEFQELEEATTVPLGEEVPSESQHERLENKARDAIPTTFRLMRQRDTEFVVFDDPEGNKKILVSRLFFHQQFRDLLPQIRPKTMPRSPTGAALSRTSLGIPVFPRPGMEYSRL
jgi:hypothetical protein